MLFFLLIIIYLFILLNTESESESLLSHLIVQYTSVKKNKIGCHGGGAASERWTPQQHSSILLILEFLCVIICI